MNSHVVNGSSQRFPRCFCSHEGYRMLINFINDECKLLQDSKKLLDKRISLDEQYARNLQELTTNADRIPWPTATHPIGKVVRIDRLFHEVPIFSIGFPRSFPSMVSCVNEHDKYL